MIKSKQELKEYLTIEKQKQQVSNNIYIYIFKYIRRIENYLLYSYQKRLRKTEYYFNTNKKIRYLFSSQKLRKLEYKYQIHIPLNCCDKGLWITHIGPILINGKTKCGTNLRININTGLTNNGVSQEAPILGDNVTIGIGSIILGANSTVTKDFKEGNYTIAGSPAKIISYKTSKDW